VALAATVLWCICGDVPKHCGMCKKIMCRECTRGKYMCATCDTAWAEVRRIRERARGERPPDSE
jgi:hypothetical protein